MKKRNFALLCLLCTLMTGTFSAAAADAYWIWAAPQVDKTTKSIANFRTEVDLPADVVEAFFYVIFDDGGEIYVNGPRVDSIFFDQPAKPIRIRKYNLKPQLKKGRNAICITVVNNGDVGGLLLKGTIRLANGKTLEFASDKAWKATMTGSPAWKKGQAAWRKAGFDDSDWNEPGILGDASLEPWAHLSTAVEFFRLPAKK